jgi:serralysin
VNEIDGLGGADTIVSLGGGDRLRGGAGADVFMYNASEDANDDLAALETIADFVSGSGDVIHLAHIDPGTAAGDQGYSFIGTAAFTDTGVAEVRFEDGVVYADNNGTGTAELAIVLEGVTSVAAGDFVL